MGGLFGGVVVVGGSLEGWPWCVQAPSEGAHLHRLYVTQLPDFLQSFGDYGAVFVKQVQKSQGGGGGIGCDLAPHSLGSKVTASIMDPTGENLRERQKKNPQKSMTERWWVVISISRRDSLPDGCWATWLSGHQHRHYPQGSAGSKGQGSPSADLSS